MMGKFWEKIKNISFENINPAYKALLALPLIVWFIYVVSNASNSFLQNKNRLEMEIDNEFKDKVIEKGLIKITETDHI